MLKGRNHALCETFMQERFKFAQRHQEKYIRLTSDDWEDQRYIDPDAEGGAKINLSMYSDIICYVDISIRTHV